METNPLAHASDFALLLGSRANRLADLGQPDQSIACLAETIEIYRELSGINPGELPRSGTALHNLAAVLAESGRHGNALAPLEEAVDIRRQLAARHPEAHLPALAGSLSTLGRVLSDVDRHTGPAGGRHQSEWCREQPTSLPANPRYSWTELVCDSRCALGVRAFQRVLTCRCGASTQASSRRTARKPLCW